MDAVTPILVDRAREPQGLRTTVVVSLGVHAVVVVAILVLPKPALREMPREVMQISLGPAGPGPITGRTPMPGRAVEAAPEAPKPAPVAPPAPRAPEMTLPKAEKTPPRQQPKSAADDAKGRVMPKAAVASPGSTAVDTGAKGMGFGLSGGGGPGGYLDVQNFCCPEYLITMSQLIQRNWNSRQEVAGDTLMKFTIQRDGRLTGIEVERTSNYFALDQTAQRALYTTRLPPLPAQFSEPTLTVHLNFGYQH
jgi:TonB family protein